MGKNLKPLWPYLTKYRVTLFWGAITVLFNNGLWSPDLIFGLAGGYLIMKTPS